jgi:hypothetical protein
MPIIHFKKLPIDTGQLFYYGCFARPPILLGVRGGVANVQRRRVKKYVAGFYKEYITQLWVSPFNFYLIR